MSLEPVRNTSIAPAQSGQAGNSKVVAPKEAVFGGGGTRGDYPGITVENPNQAQIDLDFMESGYALTSDGVKAARKENGIGTSFGAKLVGNKGLDEERTIEIHNYYAKKIFAEGYGDDPNIANLVKQYISELPRAARRGQELEYRTACDQKLEEFRDCLRSINLAAQHGVMEGNASIRHEQVKDAIQQQTEDINGHTDQTVGQAVTDINKHTDESNAQQTKAINKNTNRVVNSAVKRINNHTSGVVNNAVHNINNYTSWAVNDAVQDINNHTSRVVNYAAQDINNHTSKTVKQQGVLDAKRQTLSDMLNTELHYAGVYRDSTVKWLGETADKVMGDPGTSFENKQAALAELIRMVDEEVLISDKDKNAFVNKYLSQEARSEN